MAAKRTPKPSPKTLQQRFGFMDEDSKTPKHDEIMLWLDKQVPALITNIYGITEDWDYERLREIFEERKAMYPRFSPEEMPTPPPRPPLKIDEKQWEYVLTSKGGDPVGFVDLFINFSRPSLNLITQTEPWHWMPFEYNEYICFEVKSAIGSLGELIRQIRMYQSYKNFPFFVVSPDDRYEDTLRDQKIGFIKYPY